MTPSESCPQCGAPLPSDAPAGLCPACLISRGIPPQPGTSRAGSSRAGSFPSRWEPPGVEELQAKLSQYEIVKMLGRGGMGAVYQGRQISLDRPVAIKILSAELEENDAGFAQRFENEARAMGKLNHPGIVTVYDFGETADGMLYIVMEYVEGTDVARMISSQKRLPSAHAMAITAHVCDALGYAHERGIIHRDIKPANIMVGYDGAVKVADFGLAKLSADGQTMGLTQSGMAMGTMHYMAPETLMLGVGSVDLRADIYAVGVMLYQMLTGKLPQGMFELPSMQVAGLDPRYDKIIAKALREDREIRYQSAGEMRADLNGILTEPVVKVAAEAAAAPAALPTYARPQRPGGQPAPAAQGGAPPQKSRRGWILAGLGVLVALAVGAFFIFRPQAPPHSDSAGTPVLQAATKEQPFVNGLGMKFVPVPILGGPTGGQRVLFSVWDTRVQDYAAYAGAKKVDDAWTKQAKDGVPAGREVNHPVVGVSWEDAQGFCQWLTEKESAEGKLPKGLKYRLPSDEEWSWAVGLPPELGTTPAEKNQKNSVDFPWGKDYPPIKKVGNYGDEAFHAKFPKDSTDKTKDQPWIKGYDDGYATTSPVGSFPANAYGLYDMGGNVWQWCEDWYDASHKDRVLRGASWAYNDRYTLLSSNRYHNIPGFRISNYGFRCVLAPASIASQASANDGAKKVTAGGASPPTPAQSATPQPTATPVPTTPAPTPQLSAPTTRATSTPIPSTPKPATEMEKWLAQVDAPQQEAFQKQVVKPFEGGVADLRARYLAALDADIAKASAAGRLAEALQWRTERQAFEKAQNVAADDAGTPAGLKALRASFRQQLAKLDQDRTLKAKALHAPYDALLAKNETLLTQSQHLDDALLLKNKRDEIARVWLAPSPIIAAGAAPRDAETFTPLFDGHTLDGWYGDTDKYQMRDGILISPPGMADIISKKEYASFDLKFDVKLSAGANNGIGIWCAGDKGALKRIQHTGFEIQIIDDSSPELANYPPWARHGSIYYFVPPLRTAMKPLGQWNAHEVIVRGTVVTVLVNGVKVQEADLATIRLQSNHRPPPDPSRRQGHLAIVGDTGTAEFRDVRIREF